MTAVATHVCESCRAAWPREAWSCFACGGVDRRVRGFIELTSDYGVPLPEGEGRDAWIACVLDIVAIDAREGDYFTSHLVFANKVLGEDWTNAAVIAARFRRTPLDASTCAGLADEWHDDPASRASRNQETRS